MHTERDQEGAGSGHESNGRVMSKNPEAVSVQSLVDDLDRSEREPTIVLDVATLEASPPTTNAAAVTEHSRLPDELTGMYYHG